MAAMNDDQPYMRFGVEEDYEDGQWIGGEFYASKQVKKRNQSRDEALFGVFAESDSDEDGGRKKRKKDGNGGGKADFTKPVNFVSIGNVVPTEELSKKEKEDRDREREREEMENVGAVRLGLGSFERAGLGLGFGMKDDRVQGEEVEEEDEEDDVLKSAYGQRILERAEKRRDMQKEKEKNKGKEKITGGGDSKRTAKGDMGSFEKHTKGFGLKMLERMGYKGGGLGKNSQGIAVPVEAKLRPKMMGMGFNDYKEKETGLGPAPGTEEEETPAVKFEKVGKLKENMWKKKKTTKKEYKTAQQLLEERISEGKGEVTQTIIDMRGAQVRVLTSLDKMNEDTGAPLDDTPMPELQHNIRLIVDLVEADIQMTDRKLRNERDSLILLQKEQDRAKEEAALQKQQLDTLESIVGALDNIQANVNAHGATLDMLGEAFQSLREFFKDEYKLYNLSALALSYAIPLMTTHLGNWNPLIAPMHGLEAMATWKALLAREGQPMDYAIFPDVEMETSQDPYTQLVREVVVPKLRAVVTNSWEPRNPESLLVFLEAWEGLLPPSILQYSLEHLVLPKLSTAVDIWDPLKESIPIHAWVHPWLPLLGARLDPLYQPIRYKLGKVLGGFVVGDPTVLAMLAPWQRVFDPASWENLLVRFIVPKLAEALRSFVVDPRNQDLDIWNAVMVWAGSVPVHHMVSLLDVGFFPQWHDRLYHWLCANPNFEEVTRWYLGWKALLPQELLSHERIRYQLTLGLQRMNQAVEETPLVQPGARENVAYLRVTEQQSFETPQSQHFGVGQEGRPPPPPPPTPLSGPPPSGPGPSQQQRNGSFVGRDQGLGGSENGAPSLSMEVDLTLKEAVEEFAQQHNVQFLPKPGRMYEGLQIFAFGAVSMCTDSAKQILLAQKEGKWVPVSLEQLLEMHRSRGGRWG